MLNTVSIQAGFHCAVCTFISVDVMKRAAAKCLRKGEIKRVYALITQSKGALWSSYHSAQRSQWRRRRDTESLNGTAALRADLAP